ncbi:MAG: T9SS type A sorting domain-containing protein, partial [Bacteroidia bacterium]|nr:T9SS type A sorting domain-containing protein [Bacteroidia bacterium]
MFCRATWTNVTGNLSGQDIYAMMIYSNNIFVGDKTYGVYKRLLSGFTGLDDLTQRFSINVYPNPTTGEFEVETGFFEKEIKVKVLNLSGQFIFADNMANPNDKSSLK